MSGANILEMELRQQNLEKEMSVLKDTVWRLTGRIYVLEAFISQKFDEVVVDFGMKLSLSAGGQSNFLSNAMQASLIVNSSKSQPHLNPGSGNSSTLKANGPSSPSGSNITISHHNLEDNEKDRQGHQGSQNSGGPIGLVTRESNEDGSRNAITSRIVCKAETRRSTGGENENYGTQSDFNVEEFVVFPQVPDFILGTEVQNGSAVNMMAEESSSEETDDPDPETMRRYSVSTSGSQPGSITFQRRNRHYKCVPCSKFFTSEWHLKAHLVKHSDGILINGQPHLQQQVSATEVLPLIQGTQIPGGSAQDSSSGSADSHQHLKPFACVYCGKGFKKRQELTVHLRIHTGEKPYKCPVCDRGFSQSSSMKTHLRIHTGEKKLKCDFCKSTFTVVHNYKKHLQTCHQMDDFP